MSGAFTIFLLAGTTTTTEFCHISVNGWPIKLLQVQWNLRTKAKLGDGPFGLCREVVLSRGGDILDDNQRYPLIAKSSD